MSHYGHRIERQMLIRGLSIPLTQLFDLVAHPDHLSQLNPDIHVLSYAPSANGGYDSVEMQSENLKMLASTELSG